MLTNATPRIKDVLLDGMSFAHKYNPTDQGRSSKSMARRKQGEELQLSAKGEKEETGWRMLSFFAAICYKQGVVCCEKYHGNMAGELFQILVMIIFQIYFKTAQILKTRFFYKMGILAKTAKAALGDVECRQFSISARSLDVNLTGNLINFVWSKLNEYAFAMHITKEDFRKYEHFI